MVSTPNGLLFFPAMFGLIFKNAINVIELKQGIFRIIDYDVQEKTQKVR